MYSNFNNIPLMLLAQPFLLATPTEWKLWWRGDAEATAKVFRSNSLCVREIERRVRERESKR
jgi:hypothetical protein